MPVRQGISGVTDRVVSAGDRLPDKPENCPARPRGLFDMVPAARRQFKHGGSRQDAVAIDAQLGIDRAAGEAERASLVHCAR